MKNSHCLSSSIAIMKYTGVWVPDGLQHHWGIAYKIYGVITQMFLFWFIILAEIGYVYTFLDDTQRMIDAAVLLLSHLVQAVKVLTIVLRQGRIKRLIQMVDGPDFNKSDPKLKAILESATQLAAIIGNFVLLSACTTGILWILVSALNTELTLPLRIACPFHVDGPMFAVLYAYTSVSVVVVGVGDAAENFLVSGVCTLASAQLDALREELRAIGADGHKNHYEKTVLCVKCHQRIIGYVDEIASIFSLPMFCQFITSSVIVCMTIYKMTIVSMMLRNKDDASTFFRLADNVCALAHTQEPIEMVSMIFYLICVFMELLMYCYPGDVLLNKSLLVSEAAYPNDCLGDNKTVRALLLIALRAQRSLKITAGGIFSVCLPTAAGVVQTSYSYYALLRQQLDKK